MLVGIQAGNMEDTGMMVEMGLLHLQCVAYNYLPGMQLHCMEMWEWPEVWLIFC